MAGFLKTDDVAQFATARLQEFGQNLLAQAQQAAAQAYVPAVQPPIDPGPIVARLNQFGQDRLAELDQARQNALQAAQQYQPPEPVRPVTDALGAFTQGTLTAAEEERQRRWQLRESDPTSWLDQAIHEAVHGNATLERAEELSRELPQTTAQPIDPTPFLQSGFERAGLAPEVAGPAAFVAGMAIPQPGAGKIPKAAHVEAALPRLAEEATSVAQREGPRVAEEVANLAARLPAEAQAMLAVRLAGAAAGGAAGIATTPEEAGPFERVARPASLAVAGFTAPSIPGAVLSRPQIDQAVLERLRQAGVMQGAGHAAQTAGLDVRTLADVTKQSILTNPLTHALNMIGNTVELVRQPIALTLGGRPGEAGAGLAAAGRAIPEAGQNAWLALRYGQAPATLGSEASKIARWQPIYRLLSAGDLFTRTLGEYQGMASKAVQMLDDAGLQRGTKQAEQFLVQHADDLWNEGARSGASGVFGPAGTRSGTASMLDRMFSRFGQYKQSLLDSSSKTDQALGALLDTQIPFQGAPSKIWQVALQRVPGITQTAGGIRIARALDRGDTYAAQKALGEVVLETLIQVQVANAIREGNITSDDDPIHPGAINLGGNWVPLRQLGGYGLPMRVMAAWADGYEKAGNQANATVGERFAAALNKSVEPLTDELPGFETLNLLAGIGQGGITRGLMKAERNIANRIGSPAFLAEATRLMDPQMRDVADTGFEQLWEPTQARIPWLAQKLPPKIDPTTGEPMPRMSAGAGSLLGLQNAPDNPLRTEVARLQKLGYSELRVPQDDPRSVAGVSLSPEEARAVTQLTGRALGERILPIVQSSAYQRMTDDQKAILLQAALNASTNARLRAFLEVVGPEAARDRIVANQRIAGRLVQQSEPLSLALESPFLFEESAARRRAAPAQQQQQQQQALQAQAPVAGVRAWQG